MSCFIQSEQFLGLVWPTNLFPKAPEAGALEMGAARISGSLAICNPPSPGALLTWLLKERGSVSSVLDPELSGQQGCAPSAAPHLALSAPDPAATRGTCRPYRRRGEAVVGSGAASPRSPARRGEAELFKGLPEAERGNWHSIGPEHPGTLALPAPSCSS